MSLVQGHRHVCNVVGRLGFVLELVRGFPGSVWLLFVSSLGVVGVCEVWFGRDLVRGGDHFLLVLALLGIDCDIWCITRVLVWCFGCVLPARF